MMTDNNRVRRLQHCCHLACFDSSRRSQHEGTTRAGPWRRQAAWRFDIATMELWAQCHLGRHSGRHSGKRLSAAECHHQCQCRWDCSCQKKPSTAHSAAPTSCRWTGDELLNGVNIDKIRGFNAFLQFLSWCTFHKWIAPTWLEIDLDTLQTATANAVARLMNFARITCYRYIKQWCGLELHGVPVRSLD